MNFSTTTAHRLVHRESYEFHFTLLLLGFWLIMSVFLVLGSLGNLLVVYIFTIRWTVRSTFTFYTSLLASSLLLKCSFQIPLVLYITILEVKEQPISAPVCRIYRGASIFFMLTTTCTFLFATLDRRKQAFNPWHIHNLTTARLKSVVIAIFAVLVSLPVHLFYGIHPIGRDETHVHFLSFLDHCKLLPQYQNTWLIKTYVGFLTAAFSLIMCVIVLVYVWLCWQITRKDNKQQKSWNVSTQEQSADSVTQDFLELSDIEDHVNFAKAVACRRQRALAGNSLLGDWYEGDMVSRKQKLSSVNAVTKGRQALRSHIMTIEATGRLKALATRERSASVEAPSFISGLRTGDETSLFALPAFLEAFQDMQGQETQLYKSGQNGESSDTDDKQEEITEISTKDVGKNKEECQKKWRLAKYMVSWRSLKDRKLNKTLWQDGKNAKDEIQRKVSTNLTSPDLASRRNSQYLINTKVSLEERGSIIDLMSGSSFSLESFQPGALLAVAYMQSQMPADANVNGKETSGEMTPARKLSEDLHHSFSVCTANEIPTLTRSASRHTLVYNNQLQRSSETDEDLQTDAKGSSSVSVAEVQTAAKGMNSVSVAQVQTAAKGTSPVSVAQVQTAAKGMNTLSVTQVQTGAKGMNTLSVAQVQTGAKGMNTLSVAQVQTGAKGMNTLSVTQVQTGAKGMNTLSVAEVQTAAKGMNTLSVTQVQTGAKGKNTLSVAQVQTGAKGMNTLSVTQVQTAAKGMNTLSVAEVQTAAKGISSVSVAEVQTAAKGTSSVSNAEQETAAKDTNLVSATELEKDMAVTSDLNRAESADQNPGNNQLPQTSAAVECPLAGSSILLHSQPLNLTTHLKQSSTKITEQKTSERPELSKYPNNNPLSLSRYEGNRTGSHGAADLSSIHEEREQAGIGKRHDIERLSLGYYQEKKGIMTLSRTSLAYTLLTLAFLLSYTFIIYLYISEAFYPAYFIGSYQGGSFIILRVSNLAFFTCDVIHPLIWGYLNFSFRKETIEIVCDWWFRIKRGCFSHQ